MEIQVAAGDAYYNGSQHSLNSAETHTLSAGDANQEKYSEAGETLRELEDLIEESEE